MAAEKTNTNDDKKQKNQSPAVKNEGKTFVMVCRLQFDRSNSF